MEVSNKKGVKEVPVHDKPLAAEGLTSYRYKGRFGWIMIGAINDEDALREAGRSTEGQTSIDKLQVWSGSEYMDAAGQMPLNKVLRSGSGGPGL